MGACQEASLRRLARVAYLDAMVDEERAVLESWTRRRKSAQALALRARIVLMASERLWSNSEIALYAALNVASGQVIGSLHQRHRAIRCLLKGRTARAD